MKFRNLTRWLIIFVIAFDVAFLLQKLGGAYDSEFGAHPDEAAHYVTGLFVRDAVTTAWDYACGGFHGSPVAIAKKYADDFYAHYPKVALGNWPPMFYLVQTAWTLPFGVSRTSVLLLMAVLAAGVAVMIYGILVGEYGKWPAAAAALLWLCAPITREYYSMVMAEMLSALTMLAATLTWGRFLDHERRRDAILFGLFASAAILTKGSGLAIVLMCAFSVLMARRLKILMRPALWASVLLVVILAGPWTWIFRNEPLRLGGWEDNNGGLSWEFTSTALPYFMRKMGVSAGMAVVAFAFVGACSRSRTSGLWASICSLAVGVVAFHSLVPVSQETRYLIPAMSALVLLSIAGVFTIARFRIFRADGVAQQKREYLWVLLLLLLTFPFALMGHARKGYSGFRPIASYLLERTQPGTRILVSSDARGEGMFVSEIAMRDQRMNLYIERASKSLVDPKGRNWNGKNLRAKFNDDDQLLKYLIEGQIEYILLDDALPEDRRVDYHDQLSRVINDHIGIFLGIADMPIVREGELQSKPLRLYRIVRRKSGSLSQT